MILTAYWFDMTEIIFKLNCLVKLRAYLKAKSWWFTLAVGIVSCLTSCAWLMDFLPPTVCSFIILITQIIGVFLPLTKYGETISALNFMIPEVQSVVLEMESYYLLIGKQTDESEIVDARKKYIAQYYEVENKYLQELMPKFKDNILNEAADERDRYLKERFLTESEVKI